MVTETDVALSDGRTLHVYDDADGPSGARATDVRLPVVWHHGTPNVGSPPTPLMRAAARLAIRWVSYDRPGYGGSTPLPGRDIASSAADVAALADALGLDRFAVMGHSGGGPHALACAALLPRRVVGVVSVSGLAPFDAVALDWFAGMAPAGAGELRAAVEGRGTLERLLASSDFDPEQFTAADHAALGGVWGWLGEVAARGLDVGTGGMVDDDRAYVTPWGFDPASIEVPVLLLHGGSDRVVPESHARWLAGHLRTARLWLRPEDGHLSVLSEGESALGWLREQADRG